MVLALKGGKDQGVANRWVENEDLTETAAQIILGKGLLVCQPQQTMTVP